MSNNYGHHVASDPVNRSGDLPFFAARFNGRAVSIRRNPDFDATISSVLGVFPALGRVRSNSLRLSARFEELGDIDVQITRDLWAEVLPRLKIVEVSVEDKDTDMIEAEMASLSMSAAAPSEDIQISILSGPREFLVTVPSNAMIKQLKNAISQHNALEPIDPILGFEDVASLEDHKTLPEYDIGPGSLVSVTANLPVFITTPNRSKVPMMITLYATVSSLKLVIRTRLDIPVHEQTLTCRGEQLNDPRPLGRYPQISRNCEIVVSRSGGQPDPPLIFLYVKPTWAQDEDDDTESCLVLPTSTILDIKVLLFNINMISPCQQGLYLRGEALPDDHTVEQHGLQTGSVLLLRIHQRGQASIGALGSSNVRNVLEHMGVNQDRLDDDSLYS